MCMSNEHVKRCYNLVNQWDYPLEELTCGKVLEWVELLWINGQNEKHFSYLGKQFGYFL